MSSVRLLSSELCITASGSNKEALAVAMASGASFIRAEGFVYSHVGDEGWTDSCAGELLRYRRNIGAQDITVLTDINKKHWYIIIIQCIKVMNTI